MTIWQFIFEIFPRFMTEDVALELNEFTDEYDIVCSMTDIEPGEVFDGVVEVRGLSVFGQMYFVKVIGEVREWTTK